MRTFVRVDLGRIAANYRALRRIVGDGVAVSAVVKANGYGHGAVEVAKALEGAGCRRFSVADVAEGVELREAGIEGEILVLLGPLPGEEEETAARSLTPLLHSRELVERWRRQAVALGRRLPCHIEIDTGMHRAGIGSCRAEEVGDLLAGVPELDVQGLATHMASSESFDDAAGERQEERFSEVTAYLEGRGLRPRLCHMANSAAAVWRPSTRLDMVRAGLSLFGYVGPRNPPDGETPFEPALEWRAKILDIREVAAGDRVGYGGDYRAPRAGRAALVSAGYGDGLRRELARGGEVLVGGERRPVRGRVSMDSVMVDVSDSPEAKPGDEVVLLGEGLDALEMARRCGTIPYEILCGISARTRRVYC